VPELAGSLLGGEPNADLLLHSTQMPDVMRRLAGDDQKGIDPTIGTQGRGLFA
jgi:hypothetical protein